MVNQSTPVHITANAVLDGERILERDLAFHLGVREDFEVRSLPDACRQDKLPDDSFVCFKPDQEAVIAGDAYIKNCIVTRHRIEVRQDRLSAKQARTIATVNRDFAMLDPGAYYAFNMRDAREHDYAAFFGTSKPIPVFQYHRRRDLAAVIHPLRPYHDFPSGKIPRLEDRQSFRSKRGQMVWRGNLTGRACVEGASLGFGSVLRSARSESHKKQLLRQSLRFAVSEMSIGHHELDAGLVLHGRIAESLTENPFLMEYCRPECSREEHLQFRYLLALDGYDGPSSWYWMLNSNSLVLRQQSAWEMFGDCFFAPWVHYVPIAADGSDLMEMFLWCERNTGECERISANARRAWSLLFDPRYQVERRQRLFQAYSAWFQAG